MGRFFRALCAAVPVLFACFSLGESQSSALGYVWVQAGEGMGHAQTCLDAGLQPTLAATEIVWNREVVSKVVESLNKTISDASVYGLHGCCVAGLWCTDADKCFTQSFGLFVNHGPLVGMAGHPVFSCLDSAVAAEDDAPVVKVASYADGSVTVFGRNLGYDENSVVVSVGGASCYNAESCSGQCRYCESSSTCGVDGVCLSRACYQLCSGLSDLSCPCDSTCQAVELYFSGYSVPSFICSPRPVEDGGCPSVGLSTTQQFRCDAPQLKYASNSADINVEVITGDGGSYNDFVFEVSKSCAFDTDCFDNDICTVDVCNSEHKTCQYVPIETCGSSSLALKEHQYSSKYDVILQTGMNWEQSNFLSLMRAEGTESTVSDYDDTPHEIVELGFNFSYFGSTYSRVSISPNGAVSLPPFQSCEIKTFGSLDCVPHKSDTNTISLWYADWNLASSDSSHVYYLRQEKADSAVVYGLSNVNVIHIIYDTAFRFRPSDQPTVNPNTFSVSMYEDGSFRVRYHTINSPAKDTDIFGIWGSRSSSSDHSNLYYHSEDIHESKITEGVDYIYCDNTLLSCPVNSCVRGGGVFQLYWDGDVGCTALGPDVVRRYECNWAGGLNSTVAFVSDSNGKKLLNCPVPVLELPDGILIKVDISVVYLVADVDKQPNYNVSVENDDILNRRSFFAVTDMINRSRSSEEPLSELVRHEVMVVYYQIESVLLTSEEPLCGCSALVGSAQSSMSYSCSACGVCTNDNSSFHPDSTDCNRECFGRAYVDDCRSCSGGSTGIEPDNTCNETAIETPDDDFYRENLTGQLVFIIIVVCFMSCVFSICMYFSRTLFVRDQEGIDMDFIFIEQTPLQGLQQQHQHQPTIRGLSAFERDALGTVKYSSALFPSKEENSECAICLLSLQPGEVCRVLPEPCGHCFHIECVDKWFDVSPACPLCKRSIKGILLGEVEPDSPSDLSTFGATEISNSSDPSVTISSTDSGRSIELANRTDGAYDRV